MKLDDLLLALVGGVVIGCIARALWPTLALWAAVILGFLGMVTGTVIYLDVFGFAPDTPNIDWWRHIWQVATGVGLVALVAAISRKLPFPR
ncbi:hypothetical protein [Nocardioides alcanivorans]|uniref:hypothetical protein n=1 Tax=Nocardioides alcanivorans TaxID=2897352 RepID=UPI001F22775B|nr:hypothetical protein [Nocardioides alcanivorans]